MTMTRSGSTIGLAVAMLATLAFAGSARAQSPTPEGTIITNTASVSFTDANSNTYTPVQASVSVTVGFVAGIDVTVASATATPNPGSTGNGMTFTVRNVGNGNDNVVITDVISIPGIITVTGYRLNGGPSQNLAALNAALAGAGGQLAPNATATIEVVYDVTAGTGGLNTDYTLRATSVRTPTVFDEETVNIAPTMTAGVEVTPKGGPGATLQHLPSNGTNYTFQFTVTNNGTGSDNFNLVGSAAGTVITIVSVDGTAGSNATINGVAPGGSRTVDVVYSIGQAAAGATDVLRLRATSVANGTVTDQGHADITVIRPAVDITKEVFRDDGTTPINNTTDRVLPGEYIRYKVTVTNSGTAVASGVVITDNLPAELTFDTLTPDVPAEWTQGGSGNNVTATLNVTLPVSGTRFVWIRARVK